MALLQKRQEPTYDSPMWVCHELHWSSVSSPIPLTPRDCVTLAAELLTLYSRPVAEVLPALDPTKAGSH